MKQIVLFVMDITNILEKYSTEIAKQLQEWGVNLTSDEIELIAVLVLFISPVIKFLVQWINKRRKINNWRMSQIKKKLESEFAIYLEENRTLFQRTKDLFMGEKNIYIETRFQEKPPHDVLDPIENNFSVLSGSLMKFYLENVLISGNKPSFIYCILAGSGMGKTTFAVNLLKQYYCKYTEKTKPYDIYLYSLSHDDIFSRIGDIEKEKRPSSVLILDALDENNEAVNNYQNFKKDLENAVQDFAIVIITCRTQFFQDEESEPKESILTYYSKNGLIEFRHYYKHYISVFNENDIKTYLRKKYPSKKIRLKAEHIVSLCKSLMVRPLLLSHIDDLIQEKNNTVLSVLDIYSILIDKWLYREVNNWGKRHPNSKTDLIQLKKSLYDFSQKLAVKIYQERETNGGLFIPERELKRFMENNNFTIEYSYKGRSLVNRDSKGNIKFAHKSFLEYFLAAQMLQDDNHHTLEDMDFMETFYTEMCRKEFQTLKSKGIIDYDEVSFSIIIYKNVNYKSHCFDWISRIKNIFISSDAINDSVLNWAGQLTKFTLFIFNFDETDSVKGILKLNNLEGLAIISNYWFDAIYLDLQERFQNFRLIRDGHFHSSKDVGEIIRKFENQKRSLPYCHFRSLGEILSLIYYCCESEETESSTNPRDAGLDYEKLMNELKFYQINIEVDKLKIHNTLGGVAISIRDHIPSVKEQVPRDMQYIKKDESGIDS